MQCSPRVLACLVVAALASSAWAQGYVVTASAVAPEEAPTNAVLVAVGTGEKSETWDHVTLPFAFRYFGVPSTDLVVGARGWLLPRAGDGLSDDDPQAPHGQDAKSGAFPFGSGGPDSADGVLAVLWTRVACVNDGTPGAGAVRTWTSGEAPSRRFVVSWENAALADGRRVTAQAQLHEGTGRIVLAYAVPAAKGSGAPICVRGLDERSGRRFMAPPDAPGLPSSGAVFEPRAVLVNSKDAPKRGDDVVWQDIRRESVTAPGSADGACYVAKGGAWFFVPDRALPASSLQRGLRLATLAAEDAAAFGGKGDPGRWVKQVLDAKAVLVPKDGGPKERVWFRIIEWFTVEDSGVAGPDEHTWNLRAMLRMAFPEGDPRSKIENYAAWRGMLRSRLSVVKLFAANQTDDTGRQFDTNRKNEYVLWCARMTTGVRSVLAPDEAPDEGWTRFPLEDENLGRVAEQHAQMRDLREVRDPSYVDGGYEYVIRSDGPVPGWETLGITRRDVLTDEDFDEGTVRASDAETPR